MPPLRLPDVVRLKALAKALKTTPASLANRLPGPARKSGGRVECLLGGEPCLFLNLAQVVVPFADARRVARRVLGIFASRTRRYSWL